MRRRVVASCPGPDTAWVAPAPRPSCPLQRLSPVHTTLLLRECAPVPRVVPPLPPPVPGLQSSEVAANKMVHAARLRSLELRKAAVAGPRGPPLDSGAAPAAATGGRPEAATSPTSQAQPAAVPGPGGPSTSAEPSTEGRGGAAVPSGARPPTGAEGEASAGSAGQDEDMEDPVAPGKISCVAATPPYPACYAGPHLPLCPTPRCDSHPPHRRQWRNRSGCFSALLPEPHLLRSSPSLAVSCGACAAGAEPNGGNGADLGRYSWTQTLSEVSVSIPVPRGTKARQVAVDIKRSSLSAGLKGEAPVLQVRLPPYRKRVSTGHAVLVPLDAATSAWKTGIYWTRSSCVLGCCHFCMKDEYVLDTQFL